MRLPQEVLDETTRTFSFLDIEAIFKAATGKRWSPDPSARSGDISEEETGALDRLTKAYLRDHRFYCLPVHGTPHTTDSGHHKCKTGVIFLDSLGFQAGLPDALYESRHTLAIGKEPPEASPDAKPDDLLTQSGCPYTVATQIGEHPSDISLVLSLAVRPFQGPDRPRLSMADIGPLSSTTVAIGSSEPMIGEWRGDNGVEEPYKLGKEVKNFVRIVGQGEEDWTARPMSFVVYPGGPRSLIYLDRRRHLEAGKDMMESVDTLKRIVSDGEGESQLQTATYAIDIAGWTDGGAEQRVTAIDAAIMSKMTPFLAERRQQGLPHRIIWKVTTVNEGDGSAAGEVLRLLRWGKEQCQTESATRESKFGV